MMTTHVWIGREPAGYEADALRRLRNALDAANVDTHLFASFQVGGHEIDLLVVKPDGIFLVELKRAGGPVVGAVNGGWKVLNGGSESPLPGGRGENPYQQMLTQYRLLTEWLEAHKGDFLCAYAAQTTWFRPQRQDPNAGAPVKIRSLLTSYPALHPESR